MYEYKAINRNDLKNMAYSFEEGVDPNVVVEHLNTLGAEGWRPAGMQLGMFEIFFREVQS